MLTELRQPDLPEWLREPYPFRTRLADIGPYRMSMVDEGPADARPLLLLHGNPAWSFLYRDLIRRCREQFRVVAPDMIGFGLSDKPSDANYHTLVRHVENLGTVVNMLGLKNVTLVAHGWGGPVGLGYAVHHAENVARLILCNTWALPVPEASRIRLPLFLRVAQNGRIGRFLDSVLNLSLPASILSRTKRKLSDWTVEAYNYPFPNFESRTAVRAFSRMFFDPSHAAHETLTEIYSSLDRVTAPADILHGALDPVLSKLPAYLLRDALRNSREPIFVENASHFLPEDAPDLLADTVLREQKPASGRQTEALFKIVS